MDAFELPKYLSSLIAAINDGAKSAQAGAIAFTLIGLFLVATAFSVTDEDLLLQHTTPISQIGVQLPVVFSLAIMPAVLLFVHIYTLIRYDMLAANLHQFRDELRETVPATADRERRSLRCSRSARTCRTQEISLTTSSERRAGTA